MLNPFHVNSQKVLHVLLIIPVVLRCSVLKQVMQNASEHSDSTVSSEQINIPNIGVFLKAIVIYKICVCSNEWQPSHPSYSGEKIKFYS